MVLTLRHPWADGTTHAALNHPNIAAIYGLEETEGVKALVMELVEGPTLADRIAQGAIPVDEALPIAKQIAEALEAAHEQGIIHRDLKPANIKVRADGTVKVLDFGLAKAMEPAVGSSSILSQSPTITTPAMTQAGMILGTAAYMSPEQARGKPVDRRADIWAFGTVLFEMLTGTRAFGGDDVSDTLANVLKVDPTWEALPSGLSPTLVVYIQRCLQKDPRQRVGDVHDVRLAMEGAFETTATRAMAAGPRPQLQVWQRPVPAVIAALLVAAGAGLAVWSLMRPPSQTPATVASFVVTTPDSEPLALTGGSRGITISRDGTHIVYQTRAGGENHLYVRSLDQLNGHTVFAAASIRDQIVSPDGAWIVFQTAADQTWKRVPIRGGAPLTLFSSPVQTAPRGASWGPDETIIFAHANTGLFRGPAAGGEVEALTTPDGERGELGHAWPEVLPGGEAVLFTIVRGTRPEDMDVAVLDLATKDRRIVLPGGSGARYEAAAVTVLFGLVALGHVALRKIDGHDQLPAFLAKECPHAA